MRLPFPRRALAAPLLLCALGLPARADTASYSLTGSWQKIASAGASVDVQNNAGAGYAVLSTASGGAPAGVLGQVLGPGEHRLYTLGADLYALGSVPVVVTTGVGGGAAVLPGSTGADFSANAAAVPMSGLTLLATVPASPARAAVEVQNQSAGTLQVVRDDGAGNAVTSVLLGPGTGAGTQGAAWSSTTFKGRIRIYGAAGAEVAAYQD